MTILSQKDNPPSKSFNSSILEKEGTWWVAKVKPRQEKAFATDLLEQCIDYYLPYYEKRTKRSDGKFRKTFLVLFPSYVPCVAEDPYRLLSLNSVSTILPIRSQVRFKEQLQQIYTANTCGIQIVPVPQSEHQLGDCVRITSGPLCGFVGIITKIKNVKTLIISVDGLGKVSVCIDLPTVQPVVNKISK